MKTIFKLSQGSTHLTVERDRDGNVTFFMEMSGEHYIPTLEMVPSEVADFIEALEND